MPPKDNDYEDVKNHNLPTKKEKVIAPLHKELSGADDPDSENAINLIRDKLQKIYDEEPEAKKELEEDKHHHGKRSKHQQFMHELSNSGKSLAEIQDAWHDYYTKLPDDEKHQVWQEFYANYNTDARKTSNSTRPTVKAPQPKVVQQPQIQTTPYEPPKRSINDIQKSLTHKVQSRSKASKKNQHFASIKFGLITGVIVMFFMLFGFFNERFIAPFISPSHNIGATPLILDEGEEIGPEPKLIIPKINVEAPVVYDQESIAEDAVQESLEDGVLHYATTPEPGEFGNAVIFGHSSNNIFNDGAYKYVFVQLNKLEKGDTFYVHKEGVRYAYKVFEKKIVKPTEVSVLGSTDRPATMTLITCDPPGTAINRLVVIGEQISPSTEKNTESTAKNVPQVEPEIIPSNAPSLWSRIVGWLKNLFA